MSDIGFLFVPKHIMAREDLTLSDKCVFGRIVGLTEQHGYCFATNEWIGKQIGLSGERVRKIISKLKKLRMLSVEVERFNKASLPPSEQWSTRRKIFIWNNATTTMVVADDQGVVVVDDQYSKEIKKRENNPPVIREANASPNLLVPLKEKTGVNPDLLKHLERKKERKANKGAWRNNKSTHIVKDKYGHGAKLTKEEGLAISLADNVDMPLMEILSEQYDLTLSEVMDCKQDYINWVLGSSFEPKVWGKNMKIYVDKFCSQKASKKKKPKKETKHKSMFDEINEQTGAFPEYLGDKDE